MYHYCSLLFLIKYYIIDVLFRAPLILNKIIFLFFIIIPTEPNCFKYYPAFFACNIHFYVNGFLISLY
jgi:hypothetical protein